MFSYGIWDTQLGSMDNLTKHWSNLSLNDREGGKMTVKKDRNAKEFTIMVNFLTN